MKIISYFLFPFFFLSLVFAHKAAQPGKDNPVLQSATSGGLDKTLLWKISGKDLKKPSYLFGTMHILCADNARLSDELKAIIKRCDEIYFEINLDDLKGMLASMKYMRMNDLKKLSDLLDSTGYAKVKNYFETHASILPFSMLERFKPMLLSGLIEEQGMNCKSTDGMELLIMKDAHIQTRKIQGLETAEYQAGLFDSIPYADQAKDLINAIDSADQNRKMTTELEEVYKRQDLDKIDELTQKGDPSINNYLDLLIYQRNRNWVHELDSLMTQKSLLIAVGAGHLPGEHGLIMSLRKKGYTLTPLKN